MIDYWSRFVTTGDPDVRGQWPDWRRPAPQKIGCRCSPRQQGDHRLRRNAPVPILGKHEGGERRCRLPIRTHSPTTWVRAWNAHDVEAVLAHFHDDVVFTSPVAARLLPETGGVVRGKAALRDYWVTALNRLPELHFDVIDVYEGESMLVINYRNQRGGLGERGFVRRRPGPRGPGTYLNEP